MIKLLTYLLTCFLPMQVSGQGEPFHPMLAEGKTWVYEYHHYLDQIDNDPPNDTVFSVSYTLSGDTVIEGKPYYKMYCEGNGHRSYYASYREEGLKVYMRTHDPVSPEDEKVFVVADFEYQGLYEPDPENWGKDPYSSIKETIDYVWVDGRQYRRHQYYEGDEANVLAIGVEGVGFLRHGLRHPNLYGPEPDCLCDYQIFTSCIENGKTIFRSSDFYREGVLTNISISQDDSIDKPSTDDGIYSISGIKVKQVLHNGLYIRKSKKIVVK